MNTSHIKRRKHITEPIHLVIAFEFEERKDSPVWIQAFVPFVPFVPFVLFVLFVANLSVEP
jgi:hypothetical protein